MREFETDIINTDFTDEEIEAINNYLAGVENETADQAGQPLFIHEVPPPLDTEVTPTSGRTHLVKSNTVPGGYIEMADLRGNIEDPDE